MTRAQRKALDVRACSVTARYLDWKRPAKNATELVPIGTRGAKTVTQMWRACRAVLAERVGADDRPR